MPRPEVVLPVEQPQPRVTIDGLTVPGAVFLTVESVGQYAADRFQLELAIGAGSMTTTGYFAALARQTVTIELALGESGYVTLIVGQIDNVRVDLLSGVATLSGRDLSARLIDAEVSETFVNQTSSQIAQAIATRRGLVANVAATRTPVGQYYELDHARFGLGLNARATTEWNLLAWLAQIEGFGLSVTGETLNFGPVGVTEPMFMTVGDFMTLSLDTATTIPMQAVMKSWNTRNKMVVTQSAGAASGNTTTLIRPNLTAAQANSMAQNHLLALEQHVSILTATMPGELVLAPNAAITLDGTNSAFDQNYIVDEVSRSVGWRRGFEQTIRAHAMAR